MKHKHYDLIVQWAADPEGYEVMFRADGYNWGRVIQPFWNDECEYKLVPKAKTKWCAVWSCSDGLYGSAWSDKRLSVGGRDAVHIGHFRRDNPDATPVFVPLGGE